MSKAEERAKQKRRKAKNHYIFSKVRFQYCGKNEIQTDSEKAAC